MMRLDGDLLRLQLEAAQVQLEGLEKDQQRYTVLTGADAVQGSNWRKRNWRCVVRIQVNTLKEQVQRTAITAPFSGHVTQLGVEVGTVLNPSMPVAMIAMIAPWNWCLRYPARNWPLSPRGNPYG